MKVLALTALFLLTLFSTAVVASQSEENDWVEVYKNLQSIVDSNVTLSRMFDTHFQNWSSLDFKPSGIPDFPCRLNVPRSPSRPTSVHKLRPGDIDVVAALGDSITAGFGLDATNLIELLTEWRGKSWSIGGDGSVEERVFTLPNLIKRFNPNVKGYSVGKNLVLTMNVLGNKKKSKFNVAKSGAKSADLKSQAEMLVQRMNSDPTVSLKDDWKLITLFIGGNDLCAYCKRPAELSSSVYGQNLQDILDYLRDNIPRAMVNLALMLDVTQLGEMSEKPVCNLLHKLVCKCGAHPATPQAEQEIITEAVAYSEVLLDVIASRRYDQTDDFTVIAQPFLVNQRLPKTTDGNPDYSYFAPDCFHFSGKGHASSAQALWNNMVEPTGVKRLSWFPKAPWECLSDSRPYIYTYENSNINSVAVEDGGKSRPSIQKDDFGVTGSDQFGEKSGGLSEVPQGKPGVTTSSALPLVLLAAIGAVCLVLAAVGLTVKVTRKRRAKSQERMPLIGQ